MEYGILRGVEGLMRNALANWWPKIRSITERRSDSVVLKKV